jgi:hypothetical protein
MASAGYSGTPLPQKLGIKEGHRVADLVARIASCRPRMQPAAGLWIAWPKRASSMATDITEDTVREVALPTGLVDHKVCAIDDTWSGLRLVIRKELRT